MSLETALADFDGKHNDVLERIFAEYPASPSLIRKLISLAHLPETRMQSGATWLIRKYFDSGFAAGERLVVELCRLLPELHSWEGMLHLCQTLPFLAIPETEKAGVEAFVRNCIAHDNKFVRAWAYNALYELARQYPDGMNEVISLLAAALQNEAASVQARIRNIMKDLDRTP